jgi:hypothetical protein
MSVWTVRTVARRAASSNPPKPETNSEYAESRGEMAGFMVRPELLGPW